MRAITASDVRRRLTRVSIRVLALAALLCARPAAASAAQDDWVIQAGAGLDPRAQSALQQIIGVDRRLLALRAYLRAADSLQARWSWSQQQLAAYPATPEGRAAAADLDGVIAAFSRANPGYALLVNRMPRSLEVQIVHWNQNRSVGRAAAALAASLEQRFGAGAHAHAPDTQALRRALMDWTPGTAAALAAPGLSAHGQARAFDFQVAHAGQVIAGLDAAAARRQWDAAGWTQKLHDAVGAAGNRFTGPLASPYEPWHYAYVGSRPPP